MSENLIVKLSGESLAKGFEDVRPLSGHTEPIANRAAVHIWLGVPYGKPERWEVIRSTPEWDGVRECTSFSARPVAGVEPLETLWDDMDGFDPRSYITVDEDTSLTVNVFKPASASLTAKLPVLVFHHGGGLNVGHAGVYLHDPTELVRYSESISQPIIAVTFNYRLNIFGFLNHPDLAENGGRSGNYGFHDQIAALEWILKFIERFGGDPQNVTCMGNSAGGFALSLLLSRNRDTSPKRLFKRLILQSGTLGTAPFRTASCSYPFYEELLVHFKIQGKTPGERMAALRAIPSDALFAFANDHRPPGGWGGNEETGPDAVFDEMPLDKLKRGQWDPNVDAVMLGNVADEGAMFGPVFQIDKPEVFQAMLGRFSPEQQMQVMRMYPEQNQAKYDARQSAFCQFMGDQLFKGPISKVSDVLSKTASKETGKSIPVYKYLFKGTLPNRSAEVLGSFHTVEIASVFQIDSLWEDGSKEEGTARTVGKYWLDFVYGRENGWPTVLDGKHLVFGGSEGAVKEESTVVDELKAARTDFWMEVLDA
ncbi:hypothetical protein CI109_106716 [Kwoniella shandongensis]|uniref:Uncharacterized protein n=1 Tax=Kwoniella shandongensis TaxID=1734106 RepID=A0A5M6C6W1_9TREE|nr:uncharacterized protein CI109_001028 [Kwoniella shandongensis]KAA5530848.1 hypothetical protein CI109_001028 [Kwoniella shandongensis]